MKHKRFEENILIDEAYTNYGKEDKNADGKKSHGIAKNFAESLEYDERKKWYHQLPQEPTTPYNSVSPEKIEELKKEANSALHGDTLAYETKTNRSGSSDHQWAKTLLNKGAIGDRVAAATILIQDNPVYNLTAIKNLINNVKPAKKRDGIVIIDALSELIISDLLIPDVKLRTFEQHPLGHIDEISSGNKQTRRNILKLWYFEDQLKNLYEVYVDSLNKFAHDSVDSNKEKAVSSMSYLLMHHPEKEKILLCNIINKLGDPSQTVASKVIYHLCQILYNHPNMKQVVLAEIEKMLFRSNISPRAQYYGVCFLNQFYLGKDDSKIAENLIKIYFSFFKASIKKGEIDSRLMSAILTGVKRAFPFADRERLSETPEHINAIHKLVHLATFNVAIHALALLFQISSASKHTSDRYYTALYRKLTNADIFNTSHSALLFSLIYKSLRQDEDTNRVASFIKRLLHLSCFMNPAQTCGMLFLVSQVLKDGKKKDALLLTWKAKELKDEISQKKESSEEIKDKSQNDEEQNTGDSEKEQDSSQQEVVEQTEEKSEEQKRVDLLHGNKQDLLNDDDEETYVDLKIDEHGNIKPKKRKKSTLTPGWFHANVKVEGENDIKNEDIVEEKEITAKIALKKTINMDRVLTHYDPFARNPSFSGANCTAYLELLLLKEHFHPTVKLFAEKVINNQIIQYSGDPLIDFSAIRFLDRFVFKNPKKRSELQQDDEIKKVRGSHPKFALRKNYSAKGLKSISVTSASYLNEDVSRIPVDEKFLYDFLQKRRTEDVDDDDSDKDSVTSEDFDKYLDSVTGAKNQDDLEDLDYLGEMEANKQDGSNKRHKDDVSDDDLGSGNDDEDDQDDAPDQDDSEGELNMSGDEDEPDLSADEDELLLEGSDEDEDEIDVPGTKNGKNKLGFKLKGKEDLGSLFASAEEFSTLLEETATNKKQGSSQDMANSDNSSRKQIAWEEKRDRWIKGFNKKVLGHKKPKGNFKNKNEGFKSKKEGFNNKKEGFNSKKEGFNNKKGGFNNKKEGFNNKKGGFNVKRKGGNIKGGGGKRKKFN